MGAYVDRKRAGLELRPLLELATRVGERLRERGETVAVAESSAGGLVAAALLAVPGASAFFQGGAVVYTRAAKERLLALGEAELADPRAATEGHALVLARAARRSLSADDPAGHACVAVVGPGERATTVRTGRDNREANMVAFGGAALGLLLEALAAD